MKMTTSQIACKITQTTSGTTNLFRIFQIWNSYMARGSGEHYKPYIISISWWNIYIWDKHDSKDVYYTNTK